MNFLRQIFLTSIFCLALSVGPPMAQAMEVVELQAENGELRAQLRISGPTVLADEQGKARLTMADELLCQLTLLAPEEGRLQLALNPDKLGDFLMGEQQRPRRQLTAAGVETSLAWTMEAARPGTLQLPEMEVRVKLGTEEKALLLPATQLIVHSSLPEGEADILPPLAPPPAKTSNWPWWSLALFTIIVLALAAWFVASRKNKTAKAPSLIELSQQELARLEQIAEPGAAEAEALSALLRQLLDDKYQLQTRGQTLPEIKAALARSRMAAEQQQELLTLLEQCQGWQFSQTPVDNKLFSEGLALLATLLNQHPPAPAEDKTCGRW